MLGAAMKQTTSLRLDAELFAAMRRVKEAEGIPVTTQIEFAVRDWLRHRGTVVEKKTDRKRGATRKRS
jgi:hypothetical protein